MKKGILLEHMYLWFGKTFCMFLFAIGVFGFLWMVIRLMKLNNR
ncbi:MAG: hypothetical protein AB2392_14620 [Neobacillus sp.]